MNVHVQGCAIGVEPSPTHPVRRENGQREVFCGLTGIVCCTARSRTRFSSWWVRVPARI